MAYYDADCAAWITLVSLSLVVIDQSYLQINQVCQNTLLASVRETCDVETLYPDMIIGMFDSPLEDRKKNEFPGIVVPEAMRKHFKLVRLVRV